jgi:EAL domain-containing protein (putative c-di-GMP-specific phosphodiesterase class I)
MDTDAETREIVRVIIVLAHSLGLKVVAEGVETQDQANMLKELGSEMAQGYLYSKPVPSDTIEQLLMSNRALEVSASQAARSASA